MLKKERSTAKIEHSNGTDTSFHRTHFQLKKFLLWRELLHLTVYLLPAFPETTLQQTCLVNVTNCLSKSPGPDVITYLIRALKLWPSHYLKYLPNHIGLIIIMENY